MLRWVIKEHTALLQQQEFTVYVVFLVNKTHLHRSTGYTTYVGNEIKQYRLLGLTHTHTLTHITRTQTHTEKYCTLVYIHIRNYINPLLNSFL